MSWLFTPTLTSRSENLLGLFGSMMMLPPSNLMAFITVISMMCFLGFSLAQQLKKWNFTSGFYLLHQENFTNVISNISIIHFMPKSKKILNLWGPSTCHRHWRDQFSKLLAPHLSVIIHLATLGFPRVPEKHPEKGMLEHLWSLEHHDKNTLKLGKRE